MWIGGGDECGGGDGDAWETDRQFGWLRMGKDGLVRWIWISINQKMDGSRPFCLKVKGFFQRT